MSWESSDIFALDALWNVAFAFCMVLSADWSWEKQKT